MRRDEEALSRLIGWELKTLRVKRSILDLILLARSLRSQDDENAEYDRALVDLVAAAAGIMEEDRAALMRLIGIRETV